MILVFHHVSRSEAAGPAQEQSDCREATWAYHNYIKTPKKAGKIIDHVLYSQKDLHNLTK